jgi:hypothetical protein
MSVSLSLHKQELKRDLSVLSLTYSNFGCYRKKRELYMKSYIHFCANLDRNPDEIGKANVILYILIRHHAMKIYGRVEV